MFHSSCRTGDLRCATSVCIAKTHASHARLRTRSRPTTRLFEPHIIQQSPQPHVGTCPPSATIPRHTEPSAAVATLGHATWWPRATKQMPRGVATENPRLRTRPRIADRVGSHTTTVHRISPFDFTPCLFELHHPRCWPRLASVNPSHSAAPASTLASPLSNPSPQHQSMQPLLHDQVTRAPPVHTWVRIGRWSTDSVPPLRCQGALNMPTVASPASLSASRRRHLCRHVTFL